MKAWVWMVCISLTWVGWAEAEMRFHPLKLPENFELKDSLKEAERGDPTSQVHCGIFLYEKANSHSNATDKKEYWIKAAKWFKLAAQQHEPEAYYYLGYCYYKERGVPKDLAKSRSHFHAAVQEGLVEPMRCLAYLHLEKGEYIEALAWLKVAQQLDPNEEHTLYWIDRLDTELTEEQIEEAEKQAKKRLATKRGSVR